MNRDDIVRWAREAGFEADESVRDVWATDGYWAEELERFAALVAAAEREACAKVCEEFDCENPYIGQARAVAFEIRQRNCK